MNFTPVASLRLSTASNARTSRGALAALTVCLLALQGCGSEAESQPLTNGFAALPPLVTESVSAFTGATLIPGTSAAPIENGVLLVSNGRIVAVGPAGEVEIPAHAEVIPLDGAYVIPGLINTHARVGVTQGMRVGGIANTRENVLNQLQLYARYGVTTVFSLGDPGTQTVFQRDAQDTPNLNLARVYTSGPVITSTTPEEALADVAWIAGQGVDWVKVRVDDFLGQGLPMTPETYDAAIQAAHRLGLPVAAHMVNLDDAKELLRRGIDFLAYSVRDRAVDQELIDLMLANDVCLAPAFTRELATFVYAERPDFFDDPHFAAAADQEVLDYLTTSANQTATQNSPTAAFYRAALPVAEANMLALHEAGVTIVLGTDSGVLPGRFQGYFEYLEMVSMQDAGMSPADVLLAATGNAAECMQLADLGTLETGKWADFVVLGDNPLEDIRALSSIREVRVAGNPVL